MAEFIYTMQKARKAHGDKVILDDVTMAFYPGAKIGVVGPNGAGKSTILKIMAGIEQPSNGEARLSPGYSVGILLQEPPLNEDKDVIGNVREGVAEVYAKLDRFNQISEEMADPDADYDKLLAEMGTLQEELDHADAWDLDSQLEQAMDALRCPPPDADVKVLSGGERRRVALCKLLLEKPDLLLLDEPTNHLDAESVAWLERYLKEYPGTVVAVTHDRYFLDDVAEWILELDRGRGYPFHGNYSGWLEQKQARLAQEEKQESARQRKLKQELEWVRQSPRARQAKSKARLSAYEELMNQASSGDVGGSDITIPPGPRLGENVIEAQGLTKAFGEKLLFENLSFRLPRSGIVGVIGPNGAGKSTLFRMLIGEEKPDKGTLTLGETVQISYVDQSREALNPKNNVWQEITGGKDTVELGKREVNSRAYCGWFGFRGSDQQKLVGTLSGGERNRVHLAKLLKQGGNLLLLDEPTNDLDVETLRSLEGALLEFPGCAVVISHDRWFLDRIATHILAFEGDSHVEWFEGNYQAYEEDRKRRMGEDADQPRRIKYRKIS